MLHYQELIFAIDHSQMEVILCSLRDHPKIVNTKSSYLGDTALSTAVELCDVKAVRTILAISGVDTNLTNLKGSTPLFQALINIKREMELGKTVERFNIYLSIANILVDAGAEVNNIDEVNALFYKHMDVIGDILFKMREKMVMKNGPDDHATDFKHFKEEMYPDTKTRPEEFHKAVALNDIEMAKKLSCNRYDPNIVGVEGNTALTWALLGAFAYPKKCSGYLAMIHVLLDAGARVDIGVWNRRGVAPFILAQQLVNMHPKDADYQSIIDKIKVVRQKEQAEYTKLGRAIAVPNFQYTLAQLLQPFFNKYEFLILRLVSHDMKNGCDAVTHISEVFAAAEKGEIYARTVHSYMSLRFFDKPNFKDFPSLSIPKDTKGMVFYRFNCPLGNFQLMQNGDEIFLKIALNDKASSEELSAILTLAHTTSIFDNRRCEFTVGYSGTKLDTVGTAETTRGDDHNMVISIACKTIERFGLFEHNYNNKYRFRDKTELYVNFCNTWTHYILEQIVPTHPTAEPLVDLLKELEKPHMMSNDSVVLALLKSCATRFPGLAEASQQFADIMERPTDQPAIPAPLFP